MSTKILKIFVKNPVLGKVKTRIAVSTGDVEALKIYQHLLRYTKEMVKDFDASKEVWYSSKIEKNDIWEKEVFLKEVQKGGDLGERMKNAFHESYLFKSCSKVILIRSDCAELSKEIIKEAFMHLLKKDLVFGPAKDGVYYLVGMSRYIPEIFEDIKWSTSEVLKQSIDRVENIGANYHLLEALNDVDVIEDWERVKEKVQKI